MTARLSPEAFAGHRVLVIGDAVLDRYQHGKAERISREAPVPVIANLASTYRCGGAANTAANITSLGSDAKLIAACGKDEQRRRLEKCCAQSGVQVQLVADAQLSTICKTRILVSGQQLLRIDDAADHRALAVKLRTVALPQLDQYQVIVLSDYGYGALGEAPELIKAANQAGVKAIVDPRGSDWSRYAGAALVTPNLEEFSAAAPGARDETAQRAGALMGAHDIGAILLTAGAAGMTLFERGKDPQQLGTRGVEVFDTTGAGDTVIALMALGMAAQAELADAAHWANTAAGIVVTKLGTASVTAAELASPPAGRGARTVALPQLLEALAADRAAGKSVAMTNGCFDILHAGHLQSLAAAARLADVLVVAVNDDKSVRSLKGADRPVIPLSERMQLLAGLGCVDYVVPFAGGDAVELVRQIKPDIYVKGGDWAANPPAEAKLARQQGAEIVFQSSTKRLSTTQIIERVRQTAAQSD